MALWYAMGNRIVMAIDVCNAMKMFCVFIFIINYHDGIKCLCSLLYLVMFKLISDIMAHWYAMWNTIVMTIDVCNAEKMICTFMFT